MSRRSQSKKRKKIQYYSPKRRAVYAAGDEIDNFVLFQLHGWICWCCKKKIDRYKRFPDLRAATVEHIIPLREGGTHTWDNVAPSHARCNFERDHQSLDRSKPVC